MIEKQRDGNEKMISEAQAFENLFVSADAIGQNI